MFAPVVNLVKSVLTDPAELHDALLFGGTFLTVWAATPTSAGLAAALATTAPALSSVFRFLHARSGNRTHDINPPPVVLPVLPDPTAPPTVGN